MSLVPLAHPPKEITIHIAREPFMNRWTFDSTKQPLRVPYHKTKSTFTQKTAVQYIFINFNAFLFIYFAIL